MDNETINRYLGMGQSEEAIVQRHHLALKGPSIVSAVIVCTVTRLRQQRETIDDLLAGPITEFFIKQTFDHASDLLLEVMNSIE